MLQWDGFIAECAELDRVSESDHSLCRRSFDFRPVAVLYLCNYIRKKHVYVPSGFSLGFKS